jgi:predicted DCC family thiol-disulfide oxidoreductase YuxK
VEDGALHFDSDHYFLKAGRFRLTLPRWMAPGRLRVSHIDCGHSSFAFVLDLRHGARAMSSQMIVVFDGLCHLCSGHARMVHRWDKARAIRLVALHSDEGRKLYKRFGLDPDDPETMVVMRNDGLIRDSDAVLEVWKALGSPWAWSRPLRHIPNALRDPLYRFIARNRYRLLGKRETCWLPGQARR